MALFVPCAAAIEFRFADLRLEDLGYSTVTQRLYGTISSASGGEYAGHFVEIDPLTGVVLRSFWVDREPKLVAMSPDAAIAFVSIARLARIVRIDLASMTTIGAPFGVGGDGSGDFWAEAIKVMPGAPNTIAVSLRRIIGTPIHQGVAVFDGGVRRPLVTPGNTGSNTITFAGTPDTLFGFNNETSEWGLREMQITPQGVTIVRTVRDVIQGFAITLIDYAFGTIFATTGRAVDASTFQLSGTYAARGLVVPDPGSQWVTFAGQDGEIRVFERVTYLLRTRHTISSVPLANPLAATACGPDCVAVAYGNGKLMVMRDLVELFRDSFE